MQSIDSTETYRYGTCKDWLCKEEETKCINIRKQYKKWLTLMMLQRKWKKEHNPSWPQISDHPYRILVTEGSGSGITNLL